MTTDKWDDLDDEPDGYVTCPACRRWWCVGSDLGFALWCGVCIAASVALAWGLTRGWQ